MLANRRVTVNLPVVDLERAKEFYERTLGLSPQGLYPDGKFVFEHGPSMQIALMPRDGGTKAEHTALSFEVDDIEAAINALAARGVVFHDYDFPGLQTVNHIANMGAEKAAWFNDPEGNILCIHEVLS